MIEVRIGTTDALEVREDPQGNQAVYPVDGERTVSFLMPDGVSAMDASTQVIGALNGVMMEVGAIPWWIESNDQAVAANLLSHYGVELNQMPERWGDGSTSDPGAPARAIQQGVAPPPDPQLPSAPVIPPEDEAFLQAQPGAQPPPVKTTKATKVEAEPQPEPEPEMSIEPEPQVATEPPPEPEPEEDS